MPSLLGLPVPTMTDPGVGEGKTLSCRRFGRGVVLGDPLRNRRHRIQPHSDQSSFHVVHDASDVLTGC